jgi:cell division transport system permease protein
VVFLLAAVAGKWGFGLAGGEQLAMLFGTFVLRIEGYLAIVAQAILIAMVTGLTSRHTVNQTLRTVE